MRVEGSILSLLGSIHTFVFFLERNAIFFVPESFLAHGRRESSASPSMTLMLRRWFTLLRYSRSLGLVPLSMPFQGKSARLPTGTETSRAHLPTGRSCEKSKLGAMKSAITHSITCTCLACRQRHNGTRSSRPTNVSWTRASSREASAFRTATTIEERSTNLKKLDMQ